MTWHFLRKNRASKWTGGGCVAQPVELAEMIPTDPTTSQSVLEEEIPLWGSSPISTLRFDPESSEWFERPGRVSSWRPYSNGWSNWGTMKFGLARWTSPPRLPCYPHADGGTLIEGPGWLTPLSTDGSVGSIVNTTRIMSLVQTGKPLQKNGKQIQVKLFEMIIAREIVATGKTIADIVPLGFSKKGIKVCEMLNPMWVEWLMGWPFLWSEVTV